MFFCAGANIFEELSCRRATPPRRKRNISVKVPMSILLSGLLRCSTRQFLYWGNFLETGPLQRKG
jgi:hypothetical protein